MFRRFSNSGGRDREKETQRAAPMPQPGFASAPAPPRSLDKNLEKRLRQLVKAASLEAQAGDWPKAEAAYTAAIALQPGAEELFRLRSEVFCRLGRAEEALWDANQALCLSPSSPEGMCCQASALVLQSRKEEAAAVLSATVRLHPHHMPAHHSLLELRGVKRFKPEAVAMSGGRFPCVLRPCSAAGKPRTAKRLPKLSEKDLVEVAEVLSRLQHPNVVKVTGYCLENKTLVFEHFSEHCEVDPDLGWTARVEAAAAICDGVLYLQQQKHTPVKFRVLAPEDVVLCPDGARKVIPSHIIRAYTKDLYHKDALGVTLLHLLGVDTSREVLLELEEEQGVQRAVASAATELVLGMDAGPRWPRAAAERAVGAGLLCVNKTWQLVDEGRTEQALMEFKALVEGAAAGEEHLMDEAAFESLEPALFPREHMEGTHGTHQKTLSLSLVDMSSRKGRSRRRTSVASLEELPTLPCARYTTAELEDATHSFSDASRLGQGEHGEVFLGKLCGVKVAVKRFFDGRKDEDGFESELLALTRFRHPNIIPFLGYCPESCAVVYEYVSGGSLQEHLTPPLAKESPLPWAQRVRIAAEVTKTLMYLHGSNPPIAHRGLKTHNILIALDGKCRISDFGLAKLTQKARLTHKSTRRLREAEGKEPRLGGLRGCGPQDGQGEAFCEENGRVKHRTGEQGAPSKGYTDPEALLTGRKTRSSDVYALGLIILQLITGFSDVEDVHQLLSESTTNAGQCSSSLQGAPPGGSTAHDSPTSSISGRSMVGPRSPNTDSSPQRHLNLEQKVGQVLSRLDAAAGVWPQDVAQDIARVAICCTDEESCHRPRLSKDLKPVLEGAIRVAARQTAIQGSRAQAPTSPSQKVEEAMDQLLKLKVTSDVQIKLVKLLYNNPQRAEMFLLTPKDDKNEWLQNLLELASD